MDDARLVDIETKLAHQELMLSELNDALSSQQAQLSELRELCQAIVEKLRAGADQGPVGDPIDERPPHY